MIDSSHCHASQPLTSSSITTTHEGLLDTISVPFPIICSGKERLPIVVHSVAFGINLLHILIITYSKYYSTLLYSTLLFSAFLMQTKDLIWNRRIIEKLQSIKSLVAIESPSHQGPLRFDCTRIIKRWKNEVRKPRVFAFNVMG